jgi:PAS domain S-box-containing protein
MDNRIKILLLVPAPYDIGRLELSLHAGGLHPVMEIVHNQQEYEKAITSSNPDIILTDYAHPFSDVLAAFHIRQQAAPQTPLIVLSGNISVDNAVNLIKMGATDLVLREKIDQLTPKILLALQESKKRIQKKVKAFQLNQRWRLLQKMMSLSLEVICTLDEEGRFVAVSNAALNVWGYLPEELAGRRAIELVDEEDRASTLKAFAYLKEGAEIVNLENRVTRKDGQTITVCWSWRWDPPARRGYGVARDATGIRQAAQKVEHLEKRLSILLQHSTEGISLIAADGNVLERWPFSLKVLELGEEEKSGKLRFDLVHPEDLAAFRQAWEKVKDSPGRTHTLEIRFRKADGSYKWLEATFHNQLQEPAVEAIVLNFRDITIRKTAEIALQTSEARLKQAQAIGRMGNWELNLTDGSCLWSDEMYRMFGADRNQIIPSFDTFASFIHPEDRQAVLSRLEKACAGLENDSIQFRILRQQGKVRHVFLEWCFEYDHQGKPFRIFGIQQDISARKLAKTALEKSEGKYRNLFKLSPTPMWVYDVATGRFLDVNEAAVNQLGYSKKEFLAMTLADIRPKAEKPGKLEQIANTLQGAPVHYHYIIKLVKKSGEVMDADINNSFVDMGGRKTRLVIATNISERMKYLHAIKEQNNRLREIAWIQSHVVRAPLARLMGLINLLQDYLPEQGKATELLSFILASANELDSVIRDIVRKTEQIQDQPKLPKD